VQKNGYYCAKNWSYFLHALFMPFLATQKLFDQIFVIVFDKKKTLSLHRQKILIALLVGKKVFKWIEKQFTREDKKKQKGRVRRIP